MRVSLFGLFLDVLISRIGNLSLHNWFYHFYFSYYLLACSWCLCSWHDFQYMLFNSDLSLHVCLTLHATWHSSCYSLSCFWQPWIYISWSRSLDR